jgi:hypothetical protein
MAGGFCDQMRKKFHGWYHRGPTLAGRETYTIANIVYGAIKKYGLLGKEPLFLAGHSRGGAAVIYVAWQLKKSGHSVDALFLFDAVERSATGENVPLLGGTNIQLIPRNVKVTYHARRDISLTTFFEQGARDAWSKYLQCLGSSDPLSCEEQRLLAIKMRRLDDAMKLRMRATYSVTGEGSTLDFGNCGTGLAPPMGQAEMVADVLGKGPLYREMKFRGSHGAIGGSPIGEQDNAWKTEAEKKYFRSLTVIDDAAMARVKAWMDKNYDEAKLALHYRGGTTPW